jgi:transposase
MTPLTCDPKCAKTQFTYAPELYDVYIGNDVDQKSFVLNIRERYRQVMTKTIPADPQQLYNFARHQFPGRRIVIGYEAGPTGFGLHDYLIGHDMPCVLISPASIPKPSNQRVKTNRIDARKLASMLAEGDFKPVRVPQGPYRELRSLVQVRENYARSQRASKQRIKALLLYTGLHTTCRDFDQHWSNHYIQHLKTIESTPAVRFRMDQLLEDLDYARRQLFKATKELRIFCQNTPDIKEHVHNLRTIPGIGLVVSATILGRIGDPRYLKGLRELSAFCGIVPREKSTGDTTRRGSITHLGNNILRALLVQAAWIAIRSDKELEQFYHRIASRHHVQYAKQKAIVAVAHKLTLRIYRVLIERREYLTR